MGEDDARVGAERIVGGGRRDADFAHGENVARVGRGVETETGVDDANVVVTPTPRIASSGIDASDADPEPASRRVDGEQVDDVRVGSRVRRPRVGQESDHLSRSVGRVVRPRSFGDFGVSIVRGIVVNALVAHGDGDALTDERSERE